MPVRLAPRTPFQGVARHPNAPTPPENLPTVKPGEPIPATGGLLHAPGKVAPPPKPVPPLKPSAPENHVPVPVLQQQGFNGGIQEFNQRVQAVVDSHTRAYGKPPSPGLTLDVAKSPLEPPDFAKLFTVPSNPMAARARGVLTNQGFQPTQPITTMKQMVAGINDSVKTGTYDQFMNQHQDVLHDLSKGASFGELSSLASAVSEAKKQSGITDLQSKVESGEITPFEANQQAAAMGLIPSWSAAQKPLDFIDRFGGQIATSLVHSPAGLWTVSKAAGLDMAEGLQHPERPNQAPRLKNIGKQMVAGVKQDVQHPLRNPGYLFLDILGVASPVAEGASRVGEAGRLARAGDIGEASKALVTKAPLQRYTLNYGGYTEQVPLSQNPLVAAAQKVLLDRRAAGANARLMGETTTGGALGSILLPRSAQDFLDSEASFAKKVSRNADARKRVEQVVQMTTAHELDHLAGTATIRSHVAGVLPRSVRGSLTRGEQKAIQVLSWDDSNPLETERQFHQSMIEQGIGNAKAHRAQLADLKLAAKAIKNPSPKFLKALEMTKQIIGDMEEKKIRDLGLLPETAEGRVAKAGQFLRNDVVEGGPRTQEESFYLPTQLRGKVKRPPAEQAGYYPVKAGPYGVPLPRDMPELTHEFTGAAIASGDYRIDATKLATEAYARTVRAVEVRAEHSKLWDVAADVPRTKWDIPIRDSQKIPDKLRAAVAKIDEGILTNEDAASLPDDMRQLLEQLYPDPKSLITQDQIDGVKWVDKRLLGEGSRLPHQPGFGAKAGQLLNAPFRFTALYLRPAYILNKLGNHAMLWMDQGIHTPPNFVRAMTGDSLYGEENMRLIHNLVGAGKSRSYVAEGVTGKFGSAVAEFWNRVADRDERVTSFIHYMRLKGYKTKAEVDRLLHDPAAKDDLVEVTRRANKALVEFDNLLPIEKDYVRHWIFVYPWVSRSAVWSIKTILDHPTKTAILSQLGRMDMGNDPIFKAAPEWFKQTGYVPVGWNHDGTVRIVNPTSVNTFSTLGDFLGLVRAETKGDKYASAEDFLGPFPQFLLHAVSGRDQYGNQYPSNQWLGSAKEVLNGLPQLSALNKATAKQKTNVSKPNVADRASLEASLNKNLKATVLSPGWLDGYGSMIAGGLSPRNVNLDALAARYWRDQNLDARHARQIDLLNKALGIQADVMQRSIPADVKQAVDDQANITYQYAQLMKKTGRAPTARERADFTINYLKQHGRISSSQARMATEALSNAVDSTEINHIRNAMLDKGGGTALRLWDRDIRTIASFTPEIFNQKVGTLFSQGLADQKKFNVSQEKLYDYGRKYVQFTHEVDKLHTSGASAEEVKAFEDAHDHPVDGMPSFVRLSWANRTPADQQQHISSITTAGWQTLSAFDKTLLGRPTPSTVTAGYAELQKIVTQQRAVLHREGKTYPSSYTRILAKYVQNTLGNYGGRKGAYDGLVSDFDFAKKPLYDRLRYLAPIQKSPNKALWDQLLTAAAGYSRYLHATSSGGSHLYNASQVRQLWKDYVGSAEFQQALKDNPGFNTEIQSLPKGTLNRLIG